MLRKGAAGFSPRFGQESPRRATALKLAAAGLGIFFVPSSIQRISMQGSPYRPLKGANPSKSTLSLVFRPDDPSGVVGNFVKIARRAARSWKADAETVSPQGSRK
jgi:DNA-binding transcriptional LysR family regulator